MHAWIQGVSTLVVGSDAIAAYGTVRSVLQMMASCIFHAGGLRARNGMKTLNNYIMASSVITFSDLLVTDQKFGMDPQEMIDF